MRSLILIAFCIGVASAASIAIDLPKIGDFGASAQASASSSVGGATTFDTDTVTDTSATASASASASSSSSTTFGSSIDLVKDTTPTITIEQVAPVVSASATADAFVTSSGEKISVNDESLGWKKISEEEALSTPCAPGAFRRVITFDPCTGERIVKPAFELKKTLSACAPCAPTVVYRPCVQRKYVPQTKCVPTIRRPCPPTYIRRPCPPTYVRRPCPPTYVRRPCPPTYIRRPCPTPTIVRRPCPPVVRTPCPTPTIVRTPCVTASASAQSSVKTTPTVITVEPCEPVVVKEEEPCVTIVKKEPEIKIPEDPCDLSQISDLFNKISTTGGASASAFASASSSSSSQVTF